MNFETQPNPMKNSLVEDRITLQDSVIKILPEEVPFLSKPGLDVYKTQDGTLIYKIDRQYQNETVIKSQHLVSMLFRGVINSAQIVNVDGVYYSVISPTENIKNPEDERADVALDADRFTLGLLTGDVEHYISTKEPNVNPLLSETAKEHHNLVIDHENQSHYLFDFEHAFVDTFLSYNYSFKKNIQSIKDIFNSVNSDFNMIEDFAGKDFEVQYPTLHTHRDALLIAIKTRLSELKKRLDPNNDEAYNFFRAIVEKTGIDLSDEKHFDFLDKFPTKEGKTYELMLLMNNRINQFYEAISDLS